MSSKQNKKSVFSGLSINLLIVTIAILALAFTVNKYQPQIEKLLHALLNPDELATGAVDGFRSYLLGIQDVPVIKDPVNPGEQLYLIKIKTVDEAEAGSNGTGRIRLIGENGATGILDLDTHLSSFGVDLYQRAKTMELYLVSKNVGKLNFVEISMEGGVTIFDSDTWVVEYIEVEVNPNDQRLVYLFDKDTEKSRNRYIALTDRTAKVYASKVPPPSVVDDILERIIQSKALLILVSSLLFLILFFILRRIFGGRKRKTFPQKKEYFSEKKGIASNIVRTE